MASEQVIRLVCLSPIAQNDQILTPADVAGCNLGPLPPPLPAAPATLNSGVVSHRAQFPTHTSPVRRFGNCAFDCTPCIFSPRPR